MTVVEVVIKNVGTGDFYLTSQILTRLEKRGTVKIIPIINSWIDKRKSLRLEGQGYYGYRR